MDRIATFGMECNYFDTGTLDIWLLSMCLGLSGR
jgi:hypothetical protein